MSYYSENAGVPFTLLYFQAVVVCPVYAKRRNGLQLHIKMLPCSCTDGFITKDSLLPRRELNEALVNYCTNAILSSSSGIGGSVEGRSHHVNRQLGYTIILSYR